MQNFNLIESPWIPVRWRSASDHESPPLVSLKEAFSRSSEIADLDCAPHERIALTRLLVCITHAALGAPEDEDEWEGFGDTLAEDIPAYLQRDEIYPHFNLLGDGPRFLQSKVEKSAPLVPTSKLFPELSTNNNPTLLDHYGKYKSRDFSNADIALALLTFQNFYPPFKTGQPQGPCSKNSPLHTILLGKNLAKSILLNSLSLDIINEVYGKIGKPIWEEAAPPKDLSSFLTGLVPIHRKLWIKNAQDGFYHITADGGFKYPTYNDGFLIPSVSVVINKKGERYLLKAKIEKAIWRDLQTLSNIRQITTEIGFSSEAPLTLLAHEDSIKAKEARIWCGTLITNESKIEIQCESTYSIDHNILTAEGQHIYASGIDYCEKISVNLASSVKVYWQKITDPDPKKPAPGKGKAERHYWHSLDQEHRKLIQLASKPKDRIGKPKIGTPEAKDSWTTTVQKAALDAFDAVCPRNTPRELQAYAAGLRKLKLTIN
ncbi:type I-E CRISPR-associated protein Cse1/CasA [Coraliomargarita algicola]|uniref:Type I-E CRISPR-associated protein Cse1/CasA n=1 Tax=Coraliomargarita algicola TaxID=3092156 RepID=A0ABZ0RHM6_9BACT|nr:type I-E CRISPR-associated protein Cse1/CasA [Coraliomargarita sp. J2-16]WPJ95666.1 type I-E CRISPR-associated protein Cse1/CasA [Coraliomargarita sp. J2-16]